MENFRSEKSGGRRETDETSIAAGRRQIADSRRRKILDANRETMAKDFGTMIVDVKRS